MDAFQSSETWPSFAVGETLGRVIGPWHGSNCGDSSVPPSASPNALSILRHCQCARRWQAAADSIARSCAAEQDALQQLRLPSSLPSADAALALGQDIVARAHQHGAVAVSEELLQQLAERCTEAGERSRS